MKKKKKEVIVVTDYTPSELKVAAEFLTNWLPFLTTSLCTPCTQTLHHRVSSLHPDFPVAAQQLPLKEIHCDCEWDGHSLGSWKYQANGCSHFVPDTYAQYISDPNSSGSWKDDTNECSRHVPDVSAIYWDTDSFGNWKDGAIECSLHVQDVSAKHWDTDSLGNWKDGAIECSPHVPDVFAKHWDTDSLGSWKDSAIECSHHVPDAAVKDISDTNSLDISNDYKLSCSEYTHGTSISDSSTSLNPMCGTDAEEDELEVESNKQYVPKKKTTLATAQRDYLRFKMVKRKKDYIFMRTIHGKRVNIVDGLELHTGVFNAAEQNEIVDFIYLLEEKGRKGELKELTFSAPKKWMPGKGRVTIQFGCCYNYVKMKDGTPPGILRNKHVDPIPHLFKVMIRRLVEWHILPPTCVPDSCIINIYEEGDCIPPHIDHHDFLRPFCTVSFLSECNIVFDSSLTVVGPGEFGGQVVIPLPLGSVLVLNGNGADVAKHCVPAVPTKRISITFRKMDEAKRPTGFVPEPDLQDLQPLQFDVGESKSLDAPESPPQVTRPPAIKEFDPEKGIWVSSSGSRSNAHYSDRTFTPKPKPNVRGLLPPPVGDFNSEKGSFTAILKKEESFTPEAAAPHHLFLVSQGHRLQVCQGCALACELDSATSH